MLRFRPAGNNDVELLFKWANDRLARENSYNQSEILFADHVKWFNNKLHSPDISFYIFTDEGKNAIGQVRIEKLKSENEAVVSIVVDENHRGKGYSSQMLRLASQDFLDKNKSYTIVAYIFKTNLPSYQSFLKAGYTLMKESVIHNIPSFILHKKPGTLNFNASLC